MVMLRSAGSETALDFGIPPGSNADVVTRLVGEHMSEFLGQAVVVENRPGGGGISALESVSRARTDGYTLLVGSMSHMSILPAATPDLPYDPLTAFSPIATFSIVPTVFMVNAASPYQTLDDLIEAAKAKPGALKFGSTAPGSNPYLAVAYLSSLAGMELTFIPYKGPPETLTALLRNELDVTVVGLPTARGLMDAGQLRALAIASVERSDLYPDVATVAERFPGFDASVWTGLFAPAGTPPEVIERVRSAVQYALEKPGVAENIVGQGSSVYITTPDELGAQIAREIETYKGLMAQIQNVN